MKLFKPNGDVLLPPSVLKEKARELRVDPAIVRQFVPYLGGGITVNLRVHTPVRDGANFAAGFFRFYFSFDDDSQCKSAGWIGVCSDDDNVVGYALDQQELDMLLSTALHQKSFQVEFDGPNAVDISVSWYKVFGKFCQTPKIIGEIDNVPSTPLSYKEAKTLYKNKNMSLPMSELTYLLPEQWRAYESVRIRFWLPQPSGFDLTGVEFVPQQNFEDGASVFACLVNKEDTCEINDCYEAEDLKLMRPSTSMLNHCLMHAIESGKGMNSFVRDNQLNVVIMCGEIVHIDQSVCC